MSKFQYPKIEGMDGILLTLNLNHKSNWMEVYNSLQKREFISGQEVMQNTNWLEKQGCGYTTLLQEEYPENYKGIYKPPFGIFFKGDVDVIKGMTCKENTITIVGDIEDGLRQAKPTNSIVWINKSQEEIDKILKLHPTGNIFYVPEFKEVNKFLEPEKGNCFIGEIWEKAKEKDYSNQSEERIYLGITKKVLIAKDYDLKQMNGVRAYSKCEDIEFVNGKGKKKEQGLEMGK